MQSTVPAQEGRPEGATPRARAEFGDALVFLCALVFARQYLMAFAGGALAWALAAAVAAAFLYLYVRTRPFAAERAGSEFWLMVVPPLVFFFLLRLPFPDLSYDVLNYRLLHSERSLRGALFAPGDFFPTPAPYNPAPDTLTGLFRLALGYRLGTILNLLALVWSALVVDKFLRRWVARAWPRAACVLLVVLAEHLLFEVNEYMVDLLALPLLLEATWLALRAGEGGTRRVVVRVALLVGLSAGLKLTNVVAALPVVALCAYEALAGPRRLKLRELPSVLALSAAAFAAPLVPFGVYLWRVTGNPFFPLANGIFRSPFWPTTGGWDERWGPRGVWETLAWPVLATFEPGRHSELAVYSGRVTLGFVAALCGLILARRESRLRALCLLLVAGCLCWSVVGMGYSRYGLYLELLSGVVVVAVASVLLKRVGTASSTADGWKSAAASLLLAALCAQAAVACRYALSYEWSMRPTALSDWGAYRHEARFIFRDRRLPDFFGAGERELFGGAYAWAEACPKTAGVEALINPSAPVISVNYPEYFATRAARERFVGAVASAPARVVSLCLPEDLAQAKEMLAARGLAAGPARPVQVPFFSQRGRIGMMLVEVARPGGDEWRAALEAFWKSAAFPDEDYRAEIKAADAPASMRVGERVTLRLRVRNLGGATWPARGDSRGMYQVNAGDRWLDAAGGRVVNDLDGRTTLPRDLPPGGEAELLLPVTAPGAAGDYVLELDMIHEGVTFFHERGSRPLRLNVRVGP